MESRELPYLRIPRKDDTSRARSILRDTKYRAEDQQARPQVSPTGKPPSTTHTHPTCPLSRIMMLSLCRSPMPSTYVATQ